MNTCFTWHLLSSSGSLFVVSSYSAWRFELLALSEQNSRIWSTLTCSPNVFGFLGISPNCAPHSHSMYCSKSRLNCSCTKHLWHAASRFRSFTVAASRVLSFVPASTACKSCRMRANASAASALSFRPNSSRWYKSLNSSRLIGASEKVVCCSS